MVSIKSILLQALAILALIFAVVFYQHKYSILHILTLGAKPFISQECTLEQPKLKLSKIKECSELKSITQPCIVRGAANEQQINEFIEINTDEVFTLKGHLSRLGNPLLTSTGLKDPELKVCSMPDMIKNTSECYGGYNGFKSLNYSSFEPFDADNFDRKDYNRADIFLGNLRHDISTAIFHSNNFEESYTLQVVGEKVWLMMEPQDFHKVFETYCLGPYNAMANACLGNLNKVQLQTVHTYPGDALFFPKAWPHMIYSKAGPNVMINFRKFSMNLFHTRDIISLISGILNKLFAITQVDLCPKGQAPTSYGHGHPNPSPIHMAMKELDFRCVEIGNKFILNWANAVRDNLKTTDEIDAEIYKQVNDFNDNN